MAYKTIIEDGIDILVVGAGLGGTGAAWEARFWGQDKKIVMDLHPEVSDLSTQSTVQGGVIINTSEADTRVMVDDGQTAVIGGLIRTNDCVIRQGAPVVKDLPIIGIFCRSSNPSNQNRDHIIFVTPRLLTDMATR